MGTYSFYLIQTQKNNSTCLFNTLAAKTRGGARMEVGVCVCGGGGYFLSIGPRTICATELHVFPKMTENCRWLVIWNLAWPQVIGQLVNRLVKRPLSSPRSISRVRRMLTEGITGHRDSLWCSPFPNIASSV